MNIDLLLVDQQDLGEFLAEDIDQGSVERFRRQAGQQLLQVVVAFLAAVVLGGTSDFPVARRFRRGQEARQSTPVEFEHAERGDIGHQHALEHRQGIGRGQRLAAETFLQAVAGLGVAGQKAHVLDRAPAHHRGRTSVGAPVGGEGFQPVVGGHVARLAGVAEQRGRRGVDHEEFERIVGGKRIQMARAFELRRHGVADTRFIEIAD